MDAEAEIAELKAQVQKLQQEVSDLRAGNVRGSKTEALMALQYDSLPDFYKSPRAIAVYKKLNIAGLVLILVSAVVFAIVILGRIQNDREHASDWNRGDQFSIPTHH